MNNHKDAIDRVELNHVLVGGQRVGFTRPTRTLHIAGQAFTPEEWIETRRRIDLLLARSMAPEDWKNLRDTIAWLGKRDRLPQELRDYEATPSRPASSFLTNNIEAITRQQRGRMAKAPWWLRWFCDSIVTKESYGKDA